MTVRTLRFALLALFLAAGPDTYAWADAKEDAEEARLAAAEGRIEEALALLDQAILSGELRGEDLAQAYNNRGNIHGMMKQPKLSLQDLNQALMLDPNYASAYYNRAITNQDLGRFEAAIADYDEVLRLIPDSVTTLFFRGVTHERLGDRRAAERDFLRARELAPNDPLVNAKLEELGLQ